MSVALIWSVDHQFVTSVIDLWNIEAVKGPN